jgi:hypothetical protein
MMGVFAEFERGIIREQDPEQRAERVKFRFEGGGWWVRLPDFTVLGFGLSRLNTKASLALAEKLKRQIMTSDQIALACQLVTPIAAEWREQRRRQWAAPGTLPVREHPLGKHPSEASSLRTSP